MCSFTKNWYKQSSTTFSKYFRPLKSTLVLKNFRLLKSTLVLKYFRNYIPRELLTVTSYQLSVISFIIGGNTTPIGPKALVAGLNPPPKRAVTRHCSLFTALSKSSVY